MWVDFSLFFVRCGSHGIYWEVGRLEVAFKRYQFFIRLNVLEDLGFCVVVAFLGFLSVLAFLEEFLR